MDLVELKDKKGKNKPKYSFKVSNGPGGVESGFSSICFLTKKKVSNGPGGVERQNSGGSYK